MYRAKIILTALMLATAACLTLNGSALAQAKSKKPTAKVSKKVTPSAAETERPSPPAVTPAEPAPAKRNERPNDDAPAKTADSRVAASVPPKSEPGYRYEFTQPAFAVTSVKIEHDDAGVGTISFKKKGEDEIITDPLRVSASSLARINKALDDLDFLSSTENYQYEKDFSHLGVVNFRLNRDGRSRTITLSWTENKNAKTLMDEYRKLSNQYIWIFDISLARDNQPLDAPRLMDSLDSMIRRNEISDVSQMEPFLRELANDERIPLIARNHADRLVKQLEKERAKDQKKKTER